MSKSSLMRLAGVLAGILLGVTSFQAQQMPETGVQIQHGQAMGHTASGRTEEVPTSPGQDAFGAIQEIVRILEADPATDWSKVDLEHPRQHLIDMDEVTVRATVKSVVAPGGLTMDMTGPGRTEQAIRAMGGPHASELNQNHPWPIRSRGGQGCSS
jgi:hypothetical protein